MIALLDQRDPLLAAQTYQVQQAAYAVEWDLIAYPDFPPLAVTAQAIQAEPDTFLGFWESVKLAGVLSFTQTAVLLDIGLIIVNELPIVPKNYGLLLFASTKPADAELRQKLTCEQ